VYLGSPQKKSLFLIRNADLGRRNRSPLAAEDLLIRNCKAGDLHAIRRIENVSFDDPYSPMVFWALYLSSNRIFRIASFNSKVIGYSIAKAETKDKATFAHLISLAVDPASRKKGVGSKMLEDTISQTKEIFQSCKGIALEVRTDNKSAIALYLRFGFQRTRTIPNYYGIGKDALAMELHYESKW
jgi:ribosomal-protein-alanine N-acetyltransferase